MDNYTKSPWEISKNIFGKDKDHAVYEIYHNGSGFFNQICEINCDGVNANDNTQLISAAPDLLESLIECLEYDWVITNNDVITRARAAIAKAKGLENTNHAGQKFLARIETDIQNFFLDKKRYSDFDYGIIAMKNDDLFLQKYEIWVEYNELMNVFEADRGMTALQKILKKDKDVFIHKFNSHTPTFNDFRYGDSPRISIIFSKIEQKNP